MYSKPPNQPSSNPNPRPPFLSVIDFWKIEFEKPSSTNWIFLVYFELDFYCLCSLQKSSSKKIFQTWFFENQVQITDQQGEILFLKKSPPQYFVRRTLDTTYNIIG